MRLKHEMVCQSHRSPIVAMTRARSAIWISATKPTKALYVYNPDVCSSFDCVLSRLLRLLLWLTLCLQSYATAAVLPLPRAADHSLGGRHRTQERLTVTSMVAFGGFIICGTDSGEVIIYDEILRQIVGQFTAHSAAITAMGCSEEKFWSGDANGVVIMYHLVGGVRISQLIVNDL